MGLNLYPIAIKAGIDRDNTALATDHWTDGENIRFYLGRPQKDGGNDEMTFNNSNTISGAARSIFSKQISTAIWSLIGTNTRLYALSGTVLTNITPLVTATTAIANSLATNYTTLANNPIATVNGSTTLTITHTAHHLLAGDVITLSGSSSVNGVPAGNINASQVVRSVTANTYTIIAATAATSSGSGGGASVIEKTSIITVTQATHGFSNGDRVKILAAAATGGIPAVEINAEHVIRGVSTNTYDFTCTTIATSSVSAAGGAATTVQGQIAAGAVDALNGMGYGLGLYGVGLYGVAKTAAVPTLPRLWSHDAFGQNPVMTPGGQTGFYMWTGTVTTAPTLVTNAPTAINYAFVSNNIGVTMGASNTPNRLQWSDQGAITVWSATAQNQAGLVDVQNAGQWISHAQVRDSLDLLFTGTQVFTFSYIGKPFVWQITLVDANSGIIAQNARAVYNGVCYWMGTNNFFMYNGGVVTPIPSNADDGLNYTRQYVFDNINPAQQSKCFAWYNPVFSEIWFHWPMGTSLECNMRTVYSITEGHWTTTPITRSCAEVPAVLEVYPKMCDSTGILYRQEKGVDANGSPLPFYVTSKYFQNGTNHTEVQGVIPDSIQTGDITLAINTVNFIQNPTVSSITNTITPTTNKVNFGTAGRNWQYEISQNVLGGNWRAGQWLEYRQDGTYD
jgi:hypothetical protein